MTRHPAIATVLLAVALVAPACGPLPAGDDGPVLVEEARMLMGTTFRLQVVAPDEATAREALEAAFDEVARVEDPLSEWRETSEISAVNRAAGQEPVEIGPELTQVAKRAAALSEATGGAFDITFAACGYLWSFRDQRIPTDDELAACLERVDWRRVRLDPEAGTLLLPEKGMRIGIAGIGKGYGVDRAAETLEQHGIVDYVADGGGDIRIRGSKPAGPWSVGIAHPRRPGEMYAALSIDAGAIVTSGDYMQFFDRDGVRYHHILDPRTGRPARGCASVTVIAPLAMDADALATGLFVMGPEAGLALVETLPGVEALFLTPELEALASSGFPEVAVAGGESGLG